MMLRAVYWLLVGVCCTAGGIYLTHAFAPEQIFFSQDQALTLTIADATVDGEIPLVGSPSHVRGRHLGPAYNWYLAALWAVTNKSIGGTFALDSACKVLALIPIGILALLLLPDRHRRWGVAGLLLAACSGGYPALFTTNWQNYTLIVPLAWLYLTGYLLLSQRWECAPLFLLSASAALQTHFSTIPLVGLFLAAALALRWRGFSLSQNPAVQRTATLLGNRLIQICAVGGTVILWIPVLLFELRYTSNLAQVFAGIFGPKQGAGVGSALHGMSNFFETYLFGAVSENALIYFSWVPILPLLGAGIMLGCGYLRSTPLLTKAFWGVLLIAVAGYGVAVARQPAPSHYYYYSALLPLPLLIAAVGGALGVAALSSQRSVIFRGCSIVFLLWFSLIWCGSIEENIQRYLKGAVPPVASLRHSTELTGWLTSQTDMPWQLETRGSQQAMRDSYYFTLGPAYRSAIKYAPLMIEMPSLLRTSAPEHEHAVIVCPRPHEPHRSRLQRELADYSAQERADLRCYGCNYCSAWTFRRTAVQSSADN